MKPVSLKLQKILACIPFINISVIFIWLFINSRYAEVPWKARTFFSITIGVLCSLPVIVAQALLANVLPDYSDTFLLIAYCIFSIVISWCIIFCQKRCGL